MHRDLIDSTVQIQVKAVIATGYGKSVAAKAEDERSLVVSNGGEL